MRMWCMHPVKGNDSNSGIFDPTSSDPFENAFLTWTAVRTNPDKANDDPVFFAVGQTYIFGFALGNTRFILCGVEEGDDPGDNDTEWRAYAKQLTNYPVFITNTDYFLGENSTWFRMYGIRCNAAGWNPPRIIDSYSGNSSKVDLVNCYFENGIIAAYKGATGTSYIKTEQCTFSNISTASIYASQCRVESENDIFKNSSTGIGLFLLNGASGQASYSKKSQYYNLFEAVRVDGRSGEAALIQQCTIDDMLIGGIINTPTNIGDTAVDSCILSRTTSPTVNSSGTLTYRYCDIYDNDNAAQGTDGGNNIYVNPLFVDMFARNYLLTEDSPCVDAGNPSLDPDDEGNVNIGALGIGEEALIEESLRTFLLADSEISSLVGDRCYSVTMPQKHENPAIMFTNVGTPRTLEINTAVSKTIGRYQIDSYADTLAGARALADAIRVRINGYAGVAGSGTIGYCEMIDSEDDYNDDLEQHKVSMDFMIGYTESLT